MSGLRGAAAAAGRSVSPMPVPKDRLLSSFAVSPDGERLAYSAESAADGRRRMFVRSLARDAAHDQELPGTIGGTTPFFSPDGSSVAYFARGAIWRMPVSGGEAPARVVDAPIDSAGGTWTHDGRIVFAPLDTGLDGSLRQRRRARPPRDRC